MFRTVVDAISADQSTLIIIAVLGLVGTLVGPVIVGGVAFLISRANRAEDRADRAAVAAHAAETAKQLRTIHGLVNSNLTEQMRLALDACERELVSLHELADLRLSLGLIPTVEALARLAETRDRITALRLKLADRLGQEGATA